MKIEKRKGQRVSLDGQRVVRSDNLAVAVLPVVAREYGSMPHGRKALERDADCSPVTAKGLIRGQHPPSAPVLLRLMARNTAIFRAVCEAIGQWPEKLVAGTDADIAAARRDLESAMRRLEALER